MKVKSTCTVITGKRLVQFASIACFLAAFLVLNVVQTAYSINNDGISGTGYGNNGNRFGSFMSCSESDTVHYFQGLTIHFKTSLSDDPKISDNSGTSEGSWTIDFMLEDSQSPMRISGSIHESKVDNNTYTLLGKETFDNVCNDVGNAITLTGECGENTRVWFANSNDEKVGSLTPPYGDKAYYLIGSKVDCA